MKQGNIRHIEGVVLTSPPMISRLRNVNVSKNVYASLFYYSTPFAQ
jgi:hypothetical protein